MPVLNGVGQSSWTQHKEQWLDRILSLHMQITKHITQRNWWAASCYDWYDINAGPGCYDGCKGSPLVFVEAAERIGMPYHATLIEQGLETVQRLRQSVNGHQSVDVLHGDHRWLLPARCRLLPRRPIRFGIIYHDPNGEPSFDVLEEVSAMPAMKRVDILIHMSGTIPKRIRHYREINLIDSLDAINKRYWIVRDITDSGPWQWTFLLGTNWDAFPEYQSAGFYKADSQDGRRILRLLTTTIAERQEQCQMNLFAHTKPTQNT